MKFLEFRSHNGTVTNGTDRGLSSIYNLYFVGFFIFSFDFGFFSHNSYVLLFFHSDSSFPPSHSWHNIYLIVSSYLLSPLQIIPMSFRISLSSSLVLLFSRWSLQVVLPSVLLEKLPQIRRLVRRKRKKRKWRKVKMKIWDF